MLLKCFQCEYAPEYKVAHATTLSFLQYTACTAHESLCKSCLYLTLDVEQVKAYYQGMAKDWLTEVNEIVDKLYKDETRGDRYLLEIFICFVADKKLGNGFVTYLKKQEEMKK